LLFYIGAADWVNSVAWSPDGLRIASANKNSTVQIWSAVQTRDTSMYEPLLTYHGHHSEVLTAVWSPDSMHIASGGDDGLVQVWQAE
jgi:WD40 repeat protein